MGISRSATLVAAYLLSTTSDFNSAAEVLDFLKARRSYVQPNSGFQRQLKKHAIACLQLRTGVAGRSGDTVIVQIDTVENDMIS